MKTTAGLILALTAFASAAQAEPVLNNYSANDMNVSLSQLYPGSAPEASVATAKTRQQVTEEFQRSRLAGTSAQYSALGGYLLKGAFPGVVAESRVEGKTREQVQDEYLASRAANTPAAYSSLDNYQMSQAFPGTVVDASAAPAAGKFAGKASSSRLQ
jgi:hypothetical protein